MHWVVGTWSGEMGELWARSKNYVGRGRKNKFSAQPAQKTGGRLNIYAVRLLRLIIGG